MQNITHTLLLFVCIENCRTKPNNTFCWAVSLESGRQDVPPSLISMLRVSFNHYPYPYNLLPACSTVRPHCWLNGALDTKCVSVFSGSVHRNTWSYKLTVTHPAVYGVHAQWKQNTSPKHNNTSKGISLYVAMCFFSYCTIIRNQHKIFKIQQFLNLLAVFIPGVASHIKWYPFRGSDVLGLMCFVVTVHVQIRSECVHKCAQSARSVILWRALLIFVRFQPKVDRILITCPHQQKSTDDITPRITKTHTWTLHHDSAINLHPQQYINTK